MFSLRVLGVKAFAAEKKIGELKKPLFKTKSLNKMLGKKKPSKPTKKLQAI